MSAFVKLFVIAILITGGCSSIRPIQAVQLTGEMTQGALIRGQTTKNAQVSLDGRSIAISPEGKFIFGFEREASLQSELKIKHADGRLEIKELHISARQYPLQKVYGIAQSITQPNPAHIARSQLDSQHTSDARKINTRLNYAFADFIWPITGRITGVYGSQRAYNDIPGSPHYGIDVAAPVGAKVVAPASGYISLAVDDMFYSGGTIIINHGYGLSSSFLHLSKLRVLPGQFVNQGDVIGEVGATGRASGPHLDWRINWFEMRLDPATIMPPIVDGFATQVTR